MRTTHDTEVCRVHVQVLSVAHQSRWLLARTAEQCKGVNTPLQTIIGAVSFITTAAPFSSMSVFYFRSFFTFACP